MRISHLKRVLPAHRETAARTALELRVGGHLTDLEWAAARARLLEFATILRDWEQNADDVRTNLEKVA
jgi:hypothetical protein